MTIKCFIKIYLFTMLLHVSLSANILSIDIEEFMESNNSVKITITNNSNEDISIPINDIPYENAIQKDILDIFWEGRKIPYIGKIIKYDIKKQRYILLHSYESYSTTINLSQYYNLPTKEEILISYKKNIIRHQFSIETYPYSLTTSITGKTKISKLIGKISLPYSQCSESQIQTINNAKSVAIELSINAHETLLFQQNLNIWSENYIRWFGSPSIDRQNIVLSSLEKISNTLQTQNIYFDCSCTEIYYSYIYPDKPYDIYLCNGFWGTEILGRDSQSGIIVSQVSQFDTVANTENHTLGEYEAEQLALDFPHFTVTNSDSYQYFVEDSFKGDLHWIVPLLSLML